MWQQHDGWQVTEFHNHFRNGWIGWGGTEAWPPRSPGLSPLDYNLWRLARWLNYGCRC